jgi:hypothetical protein
MHFGMFLNSNLAFISCYLLGTAAKYGGRGILAGKHCQLTIKHVADGAPGANSKRIYS